eukprot:GHVS01083642.1.p1 GENE.GHVS01083642.1~~GHVS01083642.1.p1  ORF type:complete len:251 (+),score=60.31 GHVS01083642.1:64-753(+)
MSVTTFSCTPFIIIKSLSKLTSYRTTTGGVSDSTASANAAATGARSPASGCSSSSGSSCSSGSGSGGSDSSNVSCSGSVGRMSLWSSSCRRMRHILEHRWFSSMGSLDWKNPTITVNFILKNGETQTVKGPEGASVLEVAHHYDIDLEGACEASLACSTCHVYVDKQFYAKLPLPVEEEDDMLDMAPALTTMSRLGCQIMLSKQLDGLTVSLPPITKNFYVDGHVPQSH